jgi:hypothetical protein
VAKVELVVLVLQLPLPELLPCTVVVAVVVAEYSMQMVRQAPVVTVVAVPVEKKPLEHQEQQIPVVAVVVLEFLVVTIWVALVVRVLSCCAMSPQLFLLQFKASRLHLDMRM